MIMSNHIKYISTMGKKTTLKEGNVFVSKLWVTNFTPFYIHVVRESVCQFWG